VAFAGGCHGFHVNVHPHLSPLFRPPSAQLVQQTISMTPQVVDYFFKLYPEIKVKHDDMVKTPQDKSKFWEEVLHSHYFNRGKMATDGGCVFGEIKI
jgi:hypothetical protein